MFWRIMRLLGELFTAVKMILFALAVLAFLLSLP